MSVLSIGQSPTFNNLAHFDEPGMCHVLGWTVESRCVYRSLGCNKGEPTETPLATSGGSTVVKMPGYHRESRGPQGNWKVIRVTLALPLSLSGTWASSSLSIDRVLVFLHTACIASGSIPCTGGLPTQHSRLMGSCFQKEGNSRPRGSLLTPPPHAARARLTTVLLGFQDSA